jgi:hypothetical protein
MEHVNHPKHYNQHPAGIECIDIIRHYTCDIANAIKYLWRAGLKAEMGMKDAEKEIEDLKKALWYIEDYRKSFNKGQAAMFLRNAEYQDAFMEMTGYTIKMVCQPYPEPVKVALDHLLCTGLIHAGLVVVNPNCSLKDAVSAIKSRIAFVEQQFAKPEPPTFEQVDIKVSAERITRAGGYKGTLDISQRYCDGLMPHALNYETTRYQTRREVENQQISILERIAADCMAMADFIKKTQ